MTETSGEHLTPAPVPGPGETQQSGLRTTAMICYVLYLVAFINGLTAIIGVIIAYIKRPEAAGTVWESHFRNLIVVFWVMFAGFSSGSRRFRSRLFRWPRCSRATSPGRRYRRWRFRCSRGC